MQANYINTLRNLILVFLLLNVDNTKAQDSSKMKKYYRLTIGNGGGTGYPSAKKESGIGVVAEFGVQNKNNVYAMGIRNIFEFEPFAQNFPNKSISSVDISYGKVLSWRANFFCSVSSGLGFVEGITRGEFLYSEPGWFGATYYEQIRFFTIGIPISPRYFGCPQESMELV